MLPWSKNICLNNLPASKAEFYQRSLPSILRGHPPSFTHGDFQRGKKKTILLRRLSPTREQDGEVGADFELTIIDWVFAGWYPSYWEYSRTVFACGPVGWWLEPLGRKGVGPLFGRMGLDGDVWWRGSGRRATQYIGWRMGLDFKLKYYWVTLRVENYGGGYSVLQKTTSW